MNKGIKKLIIALIAIIVLGFGAINILWYCHYSDYMDYRNALSKEVVGGETIYTLSKNGYKYSIKCPDYLDFGGNMAIVDHNVESDGAEPVLLIWHKLFNKNKYGVILHLNGDRNSSYQIYVDKDGNPVFEKNDSDDFRNEAESIAQENKETIAGLLSAMNDVWDIE
jgi:hypothetical protein